MRSDDSGNSLRLASPASGSHLRMSLRLRVMAESFVPAARAHQREGLRAFHGREASGEGDGAFEDGAVGAVRARQRLAFFLAAVAERAAPARSLALAAAGFFLVS